MKEHIITFNENGGEYSGYLKVICNKLEKLDSKTVYADHVRIEIDEDITDIT